PRRDGRLRSGATVNAILTAVCEFLRFCARTGVIEQAVADRLSEPRWLRFTPPGFDAGESGQFRMVRTRTLKARAEAVFPEAFTPEQAERVAACCRRPRERFMVALLRDGGLRIAPIRSAPASRFAACGLCGAGSSRSRAAPGQSQWCAGEVAVCPHRADEPGGALDVRGLPIRTHGDPRRRRLRHGVCQPLPRTAGRADDLSCGETVLRTAGHRLRVCGAPSYAAHGGHE